MSKIVRAPVHVRTHKCTEGVLMEDHQKYQVEFMNGSNVFLTEEQAAKIMHGLARDSLPKFIQIGPEMFATHQIIGVTKRKTYKRWYVGEDNLPEPTHECIYCKEKYTKSWSSHASQCDKNPYKQQATAMLEESNYHNNDARHL